MTLCSICSTSVSCVQLQWGELFVLCVCVQPFSQGYSTFVCSKPLGTFLHHQVLQWWTCGEQHEPCRVHCVLSVCVASITRLAWFPFVYKHSFECLWTSITWLLNPPVDMPFPWKSAKQIFCHFRGLCIKVSEAKNECLLKLKCPISNICFSPYLTHAICIPPNLHYLQFRKITK